MTKELNDAIIAIIKSYDDEDYGKNKKTGQKLKALKDAYNENWNGKTLTQERVIFVEKCLQQGMSKREAARQLVKRDPRIGKGSAETIVYQNFSGMYQTTRRGRRYKYSNNPPKPIEESQNILETPDISNDEELL
jgi:hypothetical protein